MQRIISDGWDSPIAGPRDDSAVGREARRAAQDASDGDASPAVTGVPSAIGSQSPMPEGQVTVPAGTKLGVPAKGRKQPRPVPLYPADPFSTGKASKKTQVRNVASRGTAGKV